MRLLSALLVLVLVGSVEGQQFDLLLRGGHVIDPRI